MPDLPAIHLELCFARTACADSAAEPREKVAITSQSREPVSQLRQLDLEFAFLGTGAPRKDVQYQAGAIDDLGIEDFLQILGLAGRKLVVEDHNVRAFKKNLLADFFGFA